MAKFYGKFQEDPILNNLIDIYLAKVMTIPKPSENKHPTKTLLELYDELDVDPDILEDGWWRYNSYYVAHHSMFGHTKNEWNNLKNYILYGKE